MKMPDQTPCDEIEWAPSKIKYREQVTKRLNELSGYMSMVCKFAENKSQLDGSYWPNRIRSKLNELLHRYQI